MLDLSRRLFSALIALTALGLSSGQSPGPSRGQSPAAEGIEVRRDVPYLGDGRAECMDLYLPTAADQPRPAVVLIHGGGWHKGDKADPLEQSLATTLARAGFVCASINYCLGGEGRPAPWPQNLKDCKAAVRYLRVHADALGVDPDRIGAMGSSAGGHLAAMLGVVDGIPAYEPEIEVLAGVSSRVQAVVDLYGPADLLTRRETAPDGTPLESLRDGPIPILLGVGRAEDPDLWRIASPTAHATPDDPPFLILHGRADRTVDSLQSVTLAARLRDAGVAAELVLVDGAGHGFDLRKHSGGAMPEFVEHRVLAFLREHLVAGGRPAMLERWHQHGGVVLPYRWFVPAASAPSAPALPLVVFLHGAGERGNDNQAQLKWGVPQFVSDERQAAYPCFVVAPQCPKGGWWTSDDNHAAVRDLVRDLIRSHPIDARRVYITGLSMGGFATWQAISRDPELYAAAVPICGGGEVGEVGAAARVPIWAFHGGADEVVPPARSRELIGALEAAGGAPKYTEYAGVGHNSWSPAYATPELFEWMFAQRK